MIAHGYDKVMLRMFDISANVNTLTITYVSLAL